MIYFPLKIDINKGGSRQFKEWILAIQRARDRT